MSWHTKEDVLNDLAEVMGNGIKEFDEQYILRGEQPPPRACTSNELDDDELYLRLHGELGDRTVNEDCSRQPPDLSGITGMLRMVDKFHGSSDFENEKSTPQNSSNTGIVITKLNVNIPEFVPRNKIVDKNTNSEKLCTEQTMDQAKIKEISDKLKSRISATSKIMTLSAKRERNMAIASLLKLHCTGNVIADETTPKLMTPEQFQNNSNEFLKEKSSQSSPKEMKSIRPIQAENIECLVEITEQVNSTNQEVEESVAKVNSWLNKGTDKQKVETRRSPALYLGPVTFKRKEIKKPKTPNSEISDKSTKTTLDVPFVPSEYAGKLTETYMARVKAKEDKMLDMWGKLERDLKAKDAEVLAKRHLSSKASSQERSNGSQS